MYPFRNSPNHPTPAAVSSSSHTQTPSLPTQTSSFRPKSAHFAAAAEKSAPLLKPHPSHAAQLLLSVLKSVSSVQIRVKPSSEAHPATPPQPATHSPPPASR